MPARKLALIDVLKAHQEPNTDRDSYLKNVGHLYGMVRKWLAPAEARKLVRVTAGGAIALPDHRVGTYDAPVLVLDLGGRQIRFTPRGYLPGDAEGRVDIDAGTRIARLLVDDGQWFFARFSPATKRFELTQEIFAEAIDELLAA